MHGLEAKYGNCIDFIYLDIDNPDTADARRQFQFLAQPLLIVLDGDGQEQWRKFGPVSGQAIENELIQVLPK